MVRAAVQPLTEVLGERRLKLLGHVLRRDRQHPLHQAAFKTQSAVPRETEQRRVGRPRQFWTTANMEKAWNIITSKDVSVPKVPFNQHDRAIRETIIDHARRYQLPFHWSCMPGTSLWSFSLWSSSVWSLYVKKLSVKSLCEATQCESLLYEATQCE